MPNRNRFVKVWRELFSGATLPELEPWVRDRRHVLAPFLEYAQRPTG